MPIRLRVRRIPIVLWSGNDDAGGRLRFRSLN
jgi:hypothetical protein